AATASWQGRHRGDCASSGRARHGGHARRSQFRHSTALMNFFAYEVTTMDTPTTARKSAKPRTVRRECCADDPCTSGSRNNYYSGKRLTADAFRVEQRYLVERRHLLNRAIHGWGVVYGYPVEMARPDPCCPGAEAGQLVIGEGLGLD